MERRRSAAETVSDLGDTDVGIGQHRLGGLDVVIRQFRRPASGAARTPRCGEARLWPFLAGVISHLFSALGA